MTVCIAGVGAYVAYKQHFLAKEKFKLDLFEKRFAVFIGARKFLTEVKATGNVKISPDLYSYRASIGEATFLFEQDMVDYLELINRKSVDCYGKEQGLEGVPVGEQRTRLVNEKSELLEWLIDQLPQLKVKFSPYLKFHTWK